MELNEFRPPPLPQQQRRPLPSLLYVSSSMYRIYVCIALKLYSTLAVRCCPFTKQDMHCMQVGEEFEMPPAGIFRLNLQATLSKSFIISFIPKSSGNPV